MHVEKIILEDGRRAERHIDKTEGGERVVSLYAEEPRPMNLEKRVRQKFKEVLAEECVETIKDGQVIDSKVSSIEPKVEMRLVEHVAKAENPVFNAQGFVTRDEFKEVMLTSIEAILAARQDAKPVMAAQAVPQFRAQAVVEERVAAEEKNNTLTLVVLGAFVVIQIGLFALLWLC